MADVLTPDEQVVVGMLRELQSKWKAEGFEPTPTHFCLRTIDRLVSEVERLRAEVREWLCDKCNYVYPGPPGSGVRCVICPRCKGVTAPRVSIEMDRLRARNEALEKVAKAGATTVEQAFDAWWIKTASDGLLHGSATYIATRQGFAAGHAYAISALNPPTSGGGT